MHRLATLVLPLCLACLNAPSKVGPGDRFDAVDLPFLDEAGPADEGTGDAGEEPSRDVHWADDPAAGDLAFDSGLDPVSDLADVPPDPGPDLAELPPDPGDATDATECGSAADCPPIPCNTALCVGGICAYHAFADGSPCDDANLCTSGEQCASGQCSGGVPANCDDLNPCTTDLCAFPGGCAHFPADGTCDDQDACTAGDSCDGGTCLPGKPVDCDDGNPCTSDACDPTSGCVHTDLSLPCDDGNACTTGDVCHGGLCTGTPADCDDANPCTADSCEPATGCTHEPFGETCDDHNACTDGDACVLGVCVPGMAVSCDDANECTSDACVPQAGCIHLDNKNPCEDGDRCTTGETCVDGKCVGGKPVDCDDANPCTQDSCVQAAGCLHLAVSGGTQCNVGNCSTDDTCQDGKCVGTGNSCDDGNPCTDDFCKEDGVTCGHANNTRPCDDGSLCTAPDSCVLGTCKGGNAPDCGDGNPCTDDSCDPQAGCTHAQNTAACDDGNACTLADTCAAGTCAGGPPRDCDDKNPCTDDSCNPTLGCTHTVRTGACDDGNACTLQDLCVNGACTGGTAQDCDDGNLCTTDSCDLKTGCVHSPNTLPCDDNSKCTTGDTCAAGKCTGKTVNCDDSNPCTTDGCVPATGCTHAPNSLPCDDKNPCTTNDTCSEGKCAGILACDDGNPCTKDTCDAALGCTHVPRPAWTACATDSWCDAKGTCRNTCVKSCPQGLGALDGCHCPVLPTAVTLCSDGVSTKDCSNIKPGTPGYGQDGHFPSGSLKYEVPVNGQVLDKLSNLTWQNAISEPVPYSNAPAKCVSAGMPYNWRLPQPQELLGLVDYSKPVCPFWDSVFGTTCPATTAGFWASPPGGAYSDSGPWSVLFGAGSTTEPGGTMRQTDKEQSRRVRCVKAVGSPVEIGGRFVDMGDDSVVDLATGLVWKHDLSLEPVSWDVALTKCRDIEWRVPNIKELASLIDLSAKGCAFWPPEFGGSCLVSTQTWSSTPSMQKPADVFIVDFGTGAVLTTPIAVSSVRLRCVKPLSWLK